jgi:hypothetical protein
MMNSGFHNEKEAGMMAQSQRDPESNASYMLELECHIYIIISSDDNAVLLIDDIVLYIVNIRTVED